MPDVFILVLTSKRPSVERGFWLVPCINCPVRCSWIFSRQQQGETIMQIAASSRLLKKEKERQINQTCFKWSMSRPISNHCYPKHYPTLRICTQFLCATEAFLIASHQQATETLLFSRIEPQLCSEIHISASLYLFRAPLILANRKRDKRNHFWRFTQKFFS